MLFRDRKLEWRLALMTFTVTGPVVFLLFWQNFIDSYRSYSWPSANGTIIGPVIEKEMRHVRRFTTEMRYFGRLRYKYKVNGKEYQSKITDYGGGKPRETREQSLNDVYDYKPGAKVTVYYDPKDPWTAVLTPGFATHRILAFSIAAFMTIVGLTTCAINIGDWLLNRGRVSQHILDKMG